MDKPAAYFAGERVWNVHRTHYYRGPSDNFQQVSDETSNMVEFTFMPDWATEPIQGLVSADQIKVKAR